MADDPVAYLRARHARAEQLARACPPGQSLLPEPADVLARVAAERQILAEHAVVHRSIGWLDSSGGEHYEELPVCGFCTPKHSSFRARVAVPEGPCRTVRLLAAGWGWTEEPS